MVAYSFKRQFVGPIRAGTKRQTIRAPRKGRGRHARPGETLQLYTAMRTKQCKKIGEATCVRLRAIELHFRRNWRRDWLRYATPGTCGIKIDGAGALAEFARRDGFIDWLELRAFWKAEHGKKLRWVEAPFVFDWVGVLIEWEPLGDAGTK
jgi:hypothetical protein